MAPNPHRKFDGPIAELADAFGAVGKAMLTVVLSFLRGSAPIDDAMGAVDEASDALRVASEQWVNETLPQVYASGARESLG